jgi:hypothetical protein
MMVCCCTSSLDTRAGVSIALLYDINGMQGKYYFHLASYLL